MDLGKEPSKFIFNHLTFLMKKLLLLLFFSCAFGYSQTVDENYNALLKKSPFNKMYPKSVASDAAEYFAEWNKIFYKGPIALKEARLAAISASVAMKCEYCITCLLYTSPSPRDS